MDKTFSITFQTLYQPDILYHPPSLVLPHCVPCADELIMASVEKNVRHVDVLIVGGGPVGAYHLSGYGQDSG